MKKTDMPQTAQAPLLDPEQVRVLAQVGLLAARRCDIAAAEVIFAAIERSHPQRAMAYAGQVVARLAVGRLQAALQAADRGLRLARPQDHAELHTLRGVVLQAAGRHRESEEAWRQAGNDPLALALRAGPPVGQGNSAGNGAGNGAGNSAGIGAGIGAVPAGAAAAPVR